MITEPQRQARRDHLGSSDISALLVLDPYKSEYDVFAEKVYDLEPDDASDAAKVGNILEPYICHWLEEKEGIPHEEAVGDPDKLYKEYPLNPLFACNLDKDIPTRETGIEAKSTSLWDEWGDGVDAVPEKVFCQTQHQMLCTGYQSMHVAVWILPMKFDHAAFIAAMTSYPLPVEQSALLASFCDCRPFIIHRDQAFIDKLIRHGEKWWNYFVIPARNGMHVDTRQLRADRASMATFRRMKPDMTATAYIKSTLYSDMDYLAMQAKKAKDAHEDAKKRLLAEKGNARFIRMEDGRIIEWKNNRFYEVKHG